MAMHLGISATLLLLSLVEQATSQAESSSTVKLHSNVQCPQPLAEVDSGHSVDCVQYWKAQHPNPGATPHENLEIGSPALQRLQGDLTSQVEFLLPQLAKWDVKPRMWGGGMLSMIRDQGCVLPWDDDLDFYMPRDDFERLRQKLEEASTESDYTWDQHWTFREAEFNPHGKWLIAFNTDSLNWVKLIPGSYKTSEHKDLGGIDISGQDLSQIGDSGKAVLKPYQNVCVWISEDAESVANHDYGQWFTYPAGALREAGLRQALLQLNASSHDGVRSVRATRTLRRLRGHKQMHSGQ